MKPEEILIAFIGVIFGGLIGAYLADAGTMKECAINGEARLNSGGHIICQPKKKETPR